MKESGINKLIAQVPLLKVIISLLALCAIIYFIFLPGLEESRLLSKQLRQKKTDLTKVETSSDEYNRLGNEMGKIKNQMEAVKDRLFWEKDISRFLNELTQLASDLPIEFISLKPDSSVSGKDRLEKDRKGKLKDYSATELSLLVTVRGSYDALVKFLKRIEGAGKFIRVDSFNIDSDSRDIYRHKMKMSLSIFAKED